MSRSRPCSVMAAVLTAFALAAVMLTAACSGKKDNDPESLPPATDLLAAADTAMSNVESTKFTIDVDGKVAGLALKSAEGTLTRDGSAEGSAAIEQSGLLIEAQFVIVEQALYLKGPTGSWQQLPMAMAATVYDPSAILDPDRGIAKLLRTASNGVTEAQEDVEGRATCRVAFDADVEALRGLLPGAPEPTSSKVWLDTETHRVAKAEFVFPGAGDGAAATVVVTLTDYDAPVTISAP